MKGTESDGTWESDGTCGDGACGGVGLAGYSDRRFFTSFLLRLTFKETINLYLTVKENSESERRVTRR